MRHARISLVALAAMCAGVTGATASAQTAVPSATPKPAAPAAVTFCPLSVGVRDVDDMHTRYAVTFGSSETGRATGVVSLWAGDRRYDVPFRDAIALDTRDRTTPATPVVVRFAAPTPLDGAAVTAIDEGGVLHPCDPWFAPWGPRAQSGPDRRTDAERTSYERFLSRARAAEPIDAPPAVADPLTCATPNRPARTIHAAEPDRTPYGMTGLAAVLVLVDPSDKVAGVRIQRSAGNGQLDDIALRTARGSEFQGQLFRCRHVMGAYIFSVDFTP